MTQFSITPLSLAHIERAFDLTTKVFAQSSSIHAALSVNMDAYRASLRPSFETMVAQNLSLAACDTDGGLLGCLIATDLQLALTQSAPNGPYPEIGALTQELMHRYLAHRQVSPGETMLVDMAAVHPKARGLGVYKALRTHVQDTALKSGWHAIVGELSSAATQHVVLDQMGHRNVAELMFADFEWRGTRPFAKITSPPSIILAERLL